MKAQFLLLFGASLLFCGCDSAEDQLDRSNLQPYTNIPPGTVVLVKMRAVGRDYTQKDALGRPQQFAAQWGGEYVFEGITEGSVKLRKTNDLKAVYYAGRMIESIKPRTETK